MNLNSENTEGDADVDKEVAVETEVVETTDVVVENVEFAESKSSNDSNGGYVPADRPSPSGAAGDGFMNIPDGIDEELPFN